MKPIYVTENDLDLDLEMMDGGFWGEEKILEKLKIDKNTKLFEFLKFLFQTFSKLKLQHSLTLGKIILAKVKAKDTILKDAEKNTIIQIIKNEQEAVVLDILHELYKKYEGEINQNKEFIKNIVNSLELYQHFEVNKFEEFEEKIKDHDSTSQPTKKYNIKNILSRKKANDDLGNDFLRLHMDIEVQLRAIREYVEIINRSLL